MKKSLLVLAISATAAVSSNASAITQGVINFQGSVTNSACIVATASENQLVTLPPVQRERLFALGVTSDVETPFQINLTGCDTTTPANIAVSFSAPTVTGFGNIMENTAGTATGVGLILHDADNSRNINSLDGLSVDSYTTPVTVTPGTMTFNFLVNYIASADVVTAGSFGATLDFSVIYP